MFSHQLGNNEPNPRGNKPRRPPFPWQMRWRLLMLVAFVILVPSLLIQNVPVLRSWAGLDELTASSQPPLAEAEIANEKVDTRLLPPSGSPNRDPLEPVVAGVQGANRVEFPRGDAEQADNFQVATRDRWARLRDGLDLSENIRLQQVLKVARGGRALAEDDRQSWLPILEQLDARWNEHHREATAALEQVPDSERSVWTPVLERMDALWNDELRPALTAAGSGQPLNDSQRQVLSELQLVLDDLALEAVRDNTVMRASEGDAWFRLFEILQTSEPQSLQASPGGRVGFVQLFKQPNEYRGKLVTVRGDARLAYRIGAPANNNGITGYYVYWLKPVGGPNRPIVIYALETPPGFPTLADKDLGQSATELDESVEFTGYFFKNWAYQAQDHTRLAPLLLAKTPVWRPALVPNRKLPSAGAAIAAVIASVIVAIALACFVYYNRPSSSRVKARFER